MMNKGRRAEHSFKWKLNSGQSQYGTFVKTASPEIIEILGFAGFDFIIIDMEHTTLSFQQVEQMVRAADLHGMHAIVRTHADSGTHILHALDLGATGIQVPQVDTAEEAASIVKHAKYPPMGIRGTTMAHRAANYGFANLRSYLEDANTYTTVVVHIETKAGYDNIERICRVEGLDVIFIGPMDLSIALDTDMNFVGGQLAKPVDRILKCCEAGGKKPGIVVNNESEYKFAVERGIPYIVWGSDLNLFKNAAVNAMDVVKQAKRS